DPRAPRDRRTDLYAWAATAYFLLTGDRPVQLAFEQGQPWARFGEEQFARLEKALAALPPAQVEHWAAQLLVDPHALRRDCPRPPLRPRRGRGRAPPGGGGGGAGRGGPPAAPAASRAGRAPAAQRHGPPVRSRPRAGSGDHRPPRFGGDAADSRAGRAGLRRP